MRNKIILIIIAVFLFSLSYAFAVDNEFCTGVNVCANINPGNYGLDCSPVPDSFCPETYGINEWLNCPVVNYGKCAPCDPDCPAGCSEDAIFVQPLADPCTNVNNLVAVDAANPINIHIFRGEANYNNVIVTPLPRCGTVGKEHCEFPFSDSLSDYEVYEGGVAECFGGDRYCYSVCTTPTPGIGVDCPFSCGRTRPGLNLSIQPSGGVVSGDAVISINARSRITLSEYSLRLTKWNTEFDEFRLVNVKVPREHPDYCSFKLTCNYINDPSECSYFIKEVYSPRGTGPENVQNSINWYTSDCSNSNYTIIAFADDSNSQSTKQVNLLTNNLDSKCKDDCPIFTSKTLNTLLARIKIWVNPS